MSGTSPSKSASPTLSEPARSPLCPSVQATGQNREPEKQNRAEWQIMLPALHVPDFDNNL